MRCSVVKTVLGLGAGLGVAAFAVVLLTARAGLPAEVPPVCSFAFGVLATGSAFWAAVSATGRQRMAWMVMAVGLSGWALGDAVWAIVVMVDPSVVHSWWLVSLGYLLLPVSGLIAAALVPNTMGSGFAGRLLLDGLLVTSSLVMIAVIAARYLDVHMGPSWQISGPFTAAYFALAVVTGIVTARAEPGRRWSPALVGVAFLAFGSTGAAYGYLGDTNGQPPAGAILGWAFGLCAFALAALSSRPGPDLMVSSRVSAMQLNQWLILSLLTLAVALGAVYFWPDLGGQSIAFGVGVVMVVVVLIRQFLLLEHNRQLQLTAANAVRRHPVTGLATRGQLDERLPERIRLHGDSSAPTSIIAVSLIDFGLIKEAVGYPIDDALLHEAGTRVLANAHPGATVTHVGDETFAVVIAGGRDAAGDLASRIVAAFDDPLHVSGNCVHVHVRHGVATTYPGEQNPVGAEELLTQALAALHAAGNGHHRDAAEMPITDCGGDPEAASPPVTAAEERQLTGLAQVERIHQLRQAVDNAELTLLYQPKFNLHTGALHGVEALVRWPHPTLGLLSPAEFLPLVNELHLAEAVTDIVLRRAVEDAAAWRKSGPTIPVAVNLSAPSLVDRTLPKRITSLLAEHGFAPGDLTVEITEDLLISDLAQARNVLYCLRDAGIRIAIDDFGSGYGSMTYLRALPVDDIKIDRQFIAPIVQDPRAEAIVKATLELAAALGLTATAEGVEDEATAEKLRKCGCNFVQGNYFSVPVSADKILPLAR